MTYEGKEEPNRSEKQAGGAFAVPRADCTLKGGRIIFKCEPITQGVNYTDHPSHSS